MYLYFANAVSDFERVIDHWILEEEWLKAIEVISRQVGIQKSRVLYQSKSCCTFSQTLNFTIASVLSLCTTHQRRQ